jgi:hypothetical protein
MNIVPDLVAVLGFGILINLASHFVGDHAKVIGLPNNNTSVQARRLVDVHLVMAFNNSIAGGKSRKPGTANRFPLSVALSVCRRLGASGIRAKCIAWAVGRKWPPDVYSPL